jgi:hypothetical protein
MKKNKILISLFLQRSRENFSPNVKPVKEKLCENLHFREIFGVRCFLVTFPQIKGTQINRAFLKRETVY